MDTLWVLIGSVGSNLLIGAYVYGKLTERVASQGKSIDKLERSDEQQWAAIGESRTDIAAIRGAKKANGHHGSF